MRKKCSKCSYIARDEGKNLAIRDAYVHYVHPFQGPWRYMYGGNMVELSISAMIVP